jgi:hypothetical protein
MLVIGAPFAAPLPSVTREDYCAGIVTFAKYKRFLSQFGSATKGAKALKYGHTGSERLARTHAAPLSKVRCRARPNDWGWSRAEVGRNVAAGPPAPVSGGSSVCGFCATVRGARVAACIARHRGFTHDHVDLEFTAAQLIPKMLAQRPKAAALSTRER